MTTEDFVGRYWPLAVGAISAAAPWIVNRFNAWKKTNDDDNKERVAYWKLLAERLEGRIASLEERLSKEVERGRECDIRSARLEGELRWVTAQLQQQANPTTTGGYVMSCSITADHEGKIIDADGAVSAMLGYRPTELIGRPVTLLLEDEAVSRHEHAMKRAAETGKVRAGVVIGKAKRRDGGLVDVAVSVRPVDHDGQPAFFATLMKMENQHGG